MMSPLVEGESSAPASRLWVPCAAVFLVVLTILMSTSSLYGITYDEPIYQSRALLAVEWLRLLVTAPAYAASPEVIDRYWSARDQHPGFFKLLTGLAGVTVGRLAAPTEVLRSGTHLLCALGFAGLYWLAARTLGWAAALYAVGALLLMPHVFGHCHLAALDGPIMALSFLTVALSWWALRAGSDVDTPEKRWIWWRCLAAGACWGLAVGTKLNAFFVPFMVFPWALVCRQRHLGKLALAFAVVGPLVFLATWPWLWHDTAARFAEYIRFHFRHYEIAVTYFGRMYQVAPWHYPLVMTAITTPPVTLLLALVGIGAGLRAMVAGGFASRDSRRTVATLAVLGLAVNLVPSCLPGTPKYNGVRLFLPTFPWVALLAAVGLRGIMDQALALPGLAAETHPGLSRRIAAGGVFAALLMPLWETAHFTPFHLSYYNAFIGGLPGALRRGMEPTYWGDTYRSAARWLAGHAEQGSTVWIEPLGFESTVRLFELGPLRPDLVIVSGAEALPHADYIVTQNKPTEFSDTARQIVAHERPVYTDGIDGVPLVFVFKPQATAGADRGAPGQGP